MSELFNTKHLDGIRKNLKKLVVLALGLAVGLGFAPLQGEEKFPPNHPYFHSVFVTTSDQPDHFTDVSQPVFRHASVPDAVKLSLSSTAGKTGELLLYFPSFSEFRKPGDEQIVMSRSEDNGKTWSKPVQIVLAGGTYEGVAVDPSIVQLSDGTLRLYFFGMGKFKGGDPAPMEGPHVIYSALSQDGVHFTVDPGERISLEGVTDPEVIDVNGRWIMYLSKGASTLVATSEDGLHFVLEEGVMAGGVPGAMRGQDGAVWLYACGEEGILAYRSDDGLTFPETAEPTVALARGETEMMCDPSPVPLDNGDTLLIYKKGERPTSHSPHQPRHRQRDVPNHPPSHF